MILYSNIWLYTYVFPGISEIYFFPLTCNIYYKGKYIYILYMLQDVELKKFFMLFNVEWNRR